MTHSSLIIPVSNRYELITHLLPSLKQFDQEITFIVNGFVSLDTIRALQNFKKERNNIKIIRIEDQLTFSEANNIASKEIDSKYLIFMNSDVFPMKGAFKEMIKTIEQTENIGALQGVLFYPQSGTIQSAGHLFFEYHNYHALKEGFLPPSFGLRKRNALSVAFCIVRKDLFDECLGFDTFFVNAYEGLDLTAKISLLGYDCMVSSKVRGYHLQGLIRNEVPRKEVKDTGKFWATTGYKLTEDLIKEIELNTTNNNLKRYRRVFNVSQIREKEKLNKLLSNSVDWIDLPDKERENIILQNNLSIHSLFQDIPSIWLTTHFSQIIGNKNIFLDYSRSKDIIIDFHSNVLLRDDIIKYFPSE